MVRVTDTNNYLGFLITSPTACSLRTRIAGSLVTFSSYTLTNTLVGGTPTIIKLVLNGASVSIFQDGTQLVNSPTTLTGGAAGLSGTGCGIWAPTAQLTSTFDNYSVTA